ncbi:chitinase 2-like [Vicia villosa]|uniref:chitinase 2-like n=1 Tax=Vicia villosa TaxID=3911 RepID=UPI00273B3154|nr:chitinase 2-like [Vicia villosa]
MSDDRSAIVTPTIYREYILKHFPTTVSSEYKPVDFIIGVASENYTPTGGTGDFHPNWSLTTFSPEKLKNLKENYPQVRFVISFGGVGTQYPFKSYEKQQWITSAVISIKDIIHLYDDNNQKNLIDGIDIHYDSIESSPDDFSYCIGEVINKLKTDLSIKSVSIAPTEHNQSHYKKLYSDNQDNIDFVGYLFTNQTYSSVEKVVHVFEKLVADYSPFKVLPGFLYPSFSDVIIKEAIIFLINHKLATGFFTYPADHDSPVGPPGPFSFKEYASKST